MQLHGLTQVMFITVGYNLYNMQIVVKVTARLPYLRTAGLRLLPCLDLVKKDLRSVN